MLRQPRLKLFVRLGLSDSYQTFDTLNELIEYFRTIKIHTPLIRCNTGVCNEQYKDFDYISLFWGNNKGDLVYKISNDEIFKLNQGVEVCSNLSC